MNDNENTLHEYYENPGLPQFDKINLLLASALLRSKIAIHNVPLGGHNLHVAFVTLGSYDKQISLFRASNGHYEALVSVAVMDAMTFAQNLVLSIVEHAFGKSPNFEYTDINKGTFISFTQKAEEEERLLRRRPLSDNAANEEDPKLFPMLFPFGMNPHQGAMSAGKVNRFSTDSNTTNASSTIAAAPRATVHSATPDEKQRSLFFAHEVEPIQYSPSEMHGGYFTRTPPQYARAAPVGMYGGYPPRDAGPMAGGGPFYGDMHHGMSGPGMMSREQSGFPYGGAYTASGYPMPGVWPYESAEDVEKRKPIIIDESKRRLEGKLKFFDESKNYGFLVLEEDGSDIFVHYDDLCKANILRELLKMVKIGSELRFSFCCLTYIGRHNRSRKAVDLLLISGGF